MFEVTNDPNPRVEELNVPDYTERVKEVYVKVEEYLIDFLNRCKIKNSEVILCPHCSAVFDKKVTKDIKEFNLQQPKRGLGSTGGPNLPLKIPKWGPLTRNIKPPHHWNN